MDAPSHAGRINLFNRAVVLNLGVATQNCVAGNIPMGSEYFIKITLFFILDEPFDKSESVWKRK
jgi:hypothetical protein